MKFYEEEIIVMYVWWVDLIGFKTFVAVKTIFEIFDDEINRVNFIFVT